MRNSLQRTILLFAAFAMAGWSQAPVVSAVVDAASYAATAGAWDGIVTIFGKNLAAETATAGSLPLPRQLGGTTVSWNGIAAPLFYVSPTQINLQVPDRSDSTLGLATGLGVVVSTAAGNSVAYNPAVETPYADGYGLFSTDASGCGQAAVLNVAQDGSMSVNGAGNSAAPGQWISVWGTGNVAPNSWEAPPDAAATPSSPLYGDIRAWPAFDLGVQTYDASDIWSGFAPGLVGVNQYNVRIPSTMREGCAVPVQIVDGSGNAYSQPLSLAIRKGGGPCVDPASTGYGQITWQKNVNTSAAQAVTESDTVTVSLQASPGKQAPAAAVYTEGSLPSLTLVQGPSCHIAGYHSLDAGTVTAQGPRLSAVEIPSASYSQGPVGGLSAYQGALPEGTVLGTGTYAVTAGGGADVGAFQAEVPLGADIQIQTSPAGAPVFSKCTPLTVTWTGGDANSWVTLRLDQGTILEGAYGKYSAVAFSERVRASAGTATLYPPSGGSTCVVPTGITGTVSVEVEPDPSTQAAFTAPGLTLGGKSSWKYVHTFEAKAVN